MEQLGYYISHNDSKELVIQTIPSSEAHTVCNYYETLKEIFDKYEMLKKSHTMLDDGSDAFKKWARTYGYDENNLDTFMDMMEVICHEILEKYPEQFI